MMPRCSKNRSHFAETDSSCLSIRSADSSFLQITLGVIEDETEESKKVPVNFLFERKGIRVDREGGPVKSSFIYFTKR